MNLANYINDLLYRYDCVIVPDFGGFVTNTTGAKLDSTTHTFYAPTKQITFNNHLKHNDGLLANYIASVEEISFEKATTLISLAVIKWQNELQSKTVVINNLGVLHLNNEKHIVFEPENEQNYLTTSFGLATVQSSAIERYREEVKPLAVKETKKGFATFAKYAAAAAVLLFLGAAGTNVYKQNEQQKVFAKQEQQLQQKIQRATFVIPNPLPTLELNVVKEKATPYHVVAGAFQFRENAEKKVKELLAKGYNAKIIGKNKWGLTQVTFNSFSDRNEATNNLYRIQKTISKDAWLLVKK
ncbi:SPOR domain-containing protein [uncultured Polaribacter sp.]|uniref:HU domain-containing protein n=1 Tax=uncultured Polaribacter sp. TaxID=174711 RepID=UPI00260F60C1|nr:SPOR domain-containing protein [uncultured Polaribacter sp.]